MFGRFQPPVRRCPAVLAVVLTLLGSAAPAAAQDLTLPPLPALDLEQPVTEEDIPPAASPTWRGAFEDSLRLLAMEHGIRMAFQDKTRRELGGPFFKDYRRSVRWPATWEDGDSAFVNYIGHPIHGAAAGFLWLDHEDGAHDPELGFSWSYWASRARATAWAAGYSVQFEFGPLSEASIGNVGLRPETTGWVDHVVTPAGALGLMVAEDALDRYFIQLVERRTSNRVLRASLRMLFNPSRTMSNTAQGRTPWHRPTRTLR
jgi:hypothetical protein